MNDEQYMLRCIQLALNGSGYVAPNPLVGCVIVHHDKIVGEGWHKEFGKAHAEINAMLVVNASLLKECTLYVNLEPCSHFGKTPPCSDAIINAGIKKVVIGMQDPFSDVNGRGIQKLQQAGVSVSVGVAANESRFLNRRFITFHSKKRPYIILKWAESADGFIGQLGERIKISNEYSQMLVHHWRSEEAGIMAGTRTVRNDNPQLNVRLLKGKNPVRIIIDRELTLDNSLHVFDGSQQTIVFTKKEKVSFSNCTFVTLEGGNEIQFMVNYLYMNNIQSILVEGGTVILNAFINSGLWDEARIIKSTLRMENGVNAPDFHHAVHRTENMGSDVINYYYNL